MWVLEGFFVFQVFALQHFVKSVEEAFQRKDDEYVSQSKHCSVFRAGISYESLESWHSGEGWIWSIMDCLELGMKGVGLGECCPSRLPPFLAQRPREGK